MLTTSKSKYFLTAVSELNFKPFFADIIIKKRETTQNTTARQQDDNEIKGQLCYTDYALIYSFFCGRNITPFLYPLSEETTG